MKSFVSRLLDDFPEVTLHAIFDGGTASWSPTRKKSADIYHDGGAISSVTKAAEDIFEPGMGMTKSVIVGLPCEMEHMDEVVGSLRRICDVKNAIYDMHTAKVLARIQ